MKTTLMTAYLLTIISSRAWKTDIEMFEEVELADMEWIKWYEQKAEGLEGHVSHFTSWKLPANGYCSLKKDNENVQNVLQMEWKYNSVPERRIILSQSGFQECKQLEQRAKAGK